MIGSQPIGPRALEPEALQGWDYLMLYDGLCGFCQACVQFVLPRDRRGRFAFAALQSDIARDVLARHGIELDPENLGSFRLVVDPGTDAERVLSEGRAALEVARGIGGVWGALGHLGRVLPRVLVDGAYRMVADNRFRLFGRADACLLPAPEHRARFLDGPGAQAA